MSDSLPVRFPRRQVTAVLFSVSVIGAILIVGLGARLVLEAELAWRCPSVALLGLPCPSCGSTRAVAALAEFRFLDALVLNPLLVCSVAVLILSTLFGFSWRNFERYHGWIVVTVAICLNWAYLIFFLPR